MMLNATLIVQILNFFLTWLVVRYLFVRPAVRVREVVTQPYTTLQQEQGLMEIELCELRDQHYRAWHLWYLQTQKVMQNRYQPTPVREPVSRRMVIPELPAHEIERLAATLTTMVARSLQRLP